jgi:hypothetical protein
MGDDDDKRDPMHHPAVDLVAGRLRLHPEAVLGTVAVPRTSWPLRGRPGPDAHPAWTLRHPRLGVPELEVQAGDGAGIDAVMPCYDEGPDGRERLSVLVMLAGGGSVWIRGPWVGEGRR